MKKSRKHKTKKPKKSQQIQPKIVSEEEKVYLELIEKAKTLDMEGKYDEALNIRKEILSRYPDDMISLMAMTENLKVLGRYKEAIALCEKGIKQVRRKEKNKDSFKEKAPWDNSLSEYSLKWRILEIERVKEYKTYIPSNRDEEINALITRLKMADDKKLFPQRYREGYKVRRKAFDREIEALKKQGGKAVPYLLELMMLDSWAAIFVPEMLNECKDELSIQGLVDGLMCDNDFICGDCIEYVGRIGAAAVPYLRKRLFEKNDAWKLSMVSALEKMKGVKEAYDLLVELLEHDDPEIVDSAGVTLGEFGNKEALPLLLEARRKIGHGEIDYGIDLLMEKEPEEELPEEESEPSFFKEKIGRNAPCPCGSGKKYKKCCLGKVETQKSVQTENKKVLLPPSARISLRTEELPELDSQLTNIDQKVKHLSFPRIGMRKVKPSFFILEESNEDVILKRTRNLIDAFYKYLKAEGLANERASKYAHAVNTFACACLIPYGGRSVFEYNNDDVYIIFGNWYIRKIRDCYLDDIYIGLKAVAAFYVWLFRLNLVDKEVVTKILKECNDFDHFRTRLENYWRTDDMEQWCEENNYDWL